MAPRKPIHPSGAMTTAERQQRSRDRRREAGERQIWVTAEEYQLIQYNRALRRKAAAQQPEAIEIPAWMNGLSPRLATALLKQGYDHQDLVTLYKGGYDWAEVPNIGSSGRSEIDDFIEQNMRSWP